MKSLTMKLVLAGALAAGMAMTGAASAQDAAATQSGTAPRWQKTCKTYAIWAGAAMEAHQQGVKVDQVFARANAPVFNGIRKQMLGLVIKAYESPRYDSKKDQQRAQREFYNHVYLACAKRNLQGK